MSLYLLYSYPLYSYTAVAVSRTLLRLATARVSVHFKAADIVPGPLMLPDMTPEPLMNSGWRLQLAYVPPRRQTPWSRFSDSVNTGTGLAGEWR